MEQPACRTILVIDDDAHMRALLQATLEAAGYRVVTAESGHAGLQRLPQQAVDLVLVDIFMPEMDGLELIRRLRTTHAGCKIIAMSGGVGQWDYLHVAKRLGAHHALRKPCAPQTALDAVSALLNAEARE